MFDGLLPLPAWGYVLVVLALTHMTIASVTIYLHRHQAHRALDLHPLAAHFFRFWLWLTTGTITKEWVAVHRKHHARVETPEDPHSPQVFGIKKVLFEGYELYKAAAGNQETLEKYGHRTPNDWLERNLYTPHCNFGIVILLIVEAILFGALGVSMWAAQMAWIPFFAAGVVNGVGHYRGYRNFEVADASTNIFPWGILIGGEELHNNHHAFASSAKLSNKWWEFDIGWGYIRTLSLLGLARVKTLPPKTCFNPSKLGVDLDTVRAVIANHVHVMADYAQEVLVKVHREELRWADKHVRPALKSIRSLLIRAESRMNDFDKSRLAQGLELSQRLAVVYQFKLQLQQIWQERSATYESLLQALQEWCRQAEATGIQALQEFAQSLRGYTLQPAYT